VTTDGQPCSIRLNVKWLGWLKIINNRNKFLHLFYHCSLQAEKAGSVPISISPRKYTTWRAFFIARNLTTPTVGITARNLTTPTANIKGSN